MKILLVGTGSIGRRHLRNLKVLGISDIVILRSQHGPSFTPESELAETQVFYNLEWLYIPLLFYKNYHTFHHLPVEMGDSTGFWLHSTSQET